jgi:hypothetical protein
MLVVTEFIFMALIVSAGPQATLCVLCRNVRSILRSSIRRRVEGGEYELCLKTQVVPRSEHTPSRS